MRLSKRVVGVTAVGGLIITAMISPAQADTNTTVGTALATIGSDTTDDVVEGLSGLSSLSADIANYKTVPIGRTIDSSANYPTAAGRPAAADCSIAAARGSTEGKNGLSASMRGASFTVVDPVEPIDNTSANYSACVGVARSSSSSFPSTSPGTGTVSRIPFAVDAIAPAVLKNSSVPKKVTYTFLKDLFTRNGAAGTAACFNITPLIPSFASGTRSSWAGFLGITDWDFSGTGGPIGTQPAGVTWGSCVTGGAPNSTGTGTGAGNGNPGDRKGGAAGTPIQEHQGGFLDGANQILPYSAAQWMVQGSQVVTDIRGSSVLVSVDFTSATNTVNNADLRHPYSLNGQGAASVGFRGPLGNFTRTVYNMVPTTLLDTTFTPPAGATQTQFLTPDPADVARFAQAFVGSTSDICSASSTILLFGFATAPDCGVVTRNP